MRASGFEIRRFAFRVLMNVERMLASWKALDVEFDLYPMRGFRENGRSDALALRILDYHGDRL